MSTCLILIGYNDFLLRTSTPEVPAHTPKKATVEAKRQRRAKMRAVTMRQARNLKAEVTR